MYKYRDFVSTLDSGYRNLKASASMFHGYVYTTKVLLYCERSRKLLSIFIAFACSNSVLLSVKNFPGNVIHVWYKFS